MLDDRKTDLPAVFYLLPPSSLRFSASVSAVGALSVLIGCSEELPPHCVPNPRCRNPPALPSLRQLFKDQSSKNKLQATGRAGTFLSKKFLVEFLPVKILQSKIFTLHFCKCLVLGMPVLRPGWTMTFAFAHVWYSTHSFAKLSLVIISHPKLWHNFTI